MGGESAVASFVRDQVRERFLLYRSERLVRNRSSAAQERVRRLCSAAKLRWTAAGELDDPPNLPASLPLYREAAVLLINALRAARDDSSPDELMTADEAWSWLDSFSARADLGSPPKSFSSARALLTTPDLLKLDGLGADDARREHETLAPTVKWLHALVEPRTVTEIRVTRAGRILVAGGALIGLLVAALVLLLTPKNLAEGKAVRASSQYPGTLTAEGVNNGAIEATFGVHTQKEDNAWVTIDLGEDRAVTKIKVYNRADGYQQEILPLVLEVSLDAASWQELSRRDHLFTATEPWVWKGSPTRARHVRVRRGTPGYIALTEIKVYGD